MIVTKAIGRGDGLDLVLRPGASPGPVMVRLAGLIPGRSYATTGGVTVRFTADAAGEATLDLLLAERLSLTVQPVA